MLIICHFHSLHIHWTVRQNTVALRNTKVVKLKMCMKPLLKIHLILILIISCITLNAQDFFQTIKDGEYEKVEQYISEEPMLIDSIVKWDLTPIMFASILGKDSIVELLLKNEADMYKVKHENGRLSIHFAAMRNYPSVVGILIAYGIDVNVKDGENKTALVYAIENNNREIIDLLLKANAKFPEEQELMNLCLHSAVLYNLQDISEKLTENGASLSGVDNFRRSLLHIAVIGNNLKWIDLLLAENININKFDIFKRTPLHYSVELNQLDITKSLVKNDAEINSIDCTNRTPLNIAQDLGHVQIADYLFSKNGILSEPKIFKIDGESDESSQLEVTYIANMGVMISSSTKTVLIDALFDKGFNYYSPTPPVIVSKINKAEPPFNSIDLILVTHSDGDHFSAPMIADYLAKNKSVKVVCNNLTSSALKESIGLTSDTACIVGITPKLCNSTDTLVDDINVKVLRLRHSGRDGQSENLGFVIEIDGIKVFHSGDSGGNFRQGEAFTEIQEYVSIGIEEMEVDLAILNRSFPWGSNRPGLLILKDQMKPKHIILTHFSENNKQGEWDTVDKTIKEQEDILPEVTVFKWPLQKIIIQKGH